MSQIAVSDLTFCYDGSYDNIFEHVSFVIDTDWKLGLTGRNGRGKTTFLNLLMGKYEYLGSITASVDFDYFPFEVEDISRDTLDILNEISLHHAPWQLKREIGLLGLDEGVLYRPFETLSHGERTKALLAALFLKENNFLLIDEPTNHLDMRARDVVKEYLNSKKGFILVSHDRAFLDGCVDHILAINKANITVSRGNFSQWWENKEREDVFEAGENEKLMGEIHRLAGAAQRTAGWSDTVERSKIGGHELDRGAVGHKAAKLMKRAKAIEKRREDAIEEKSKLLKNIERNENLAVHPLETKATRLVEIRSLSVDYGEKPVFTDFSLELSRGERIALTGPNGCGKSSIIKLVAGEEIPHTGTVRLASGLVVSRVPQDTSFLAGSLMDYAESKGVDLTLFLTILRKFDFPRAQFDRDMSDFSAGQRKKVVLAGSLAQRAHIYIWDEPLNYIDVISRIQIESLIKNGRPTMLFVEHDRAFVESVATRTVDM